VSSPARAAVVLGGAAAGGAAEDRIVRGELPPMPELTCCPSPAGVRLEPVLTKLLAAWALEFHHDGQRFATDQ
jgi:hypothetical protein